jgi:hypothetical protein
VTTVKDIMRDELEAPKIVDRSTFPANDATKGSFEKRGFGCCDDKTGVNAHQGLPPLPEQQASGRLWGLLHHSAAPAGG